MKFEKILPWITLLSGLPLCIAGGFCIYTYVWGAVISRIGDGDQSLLFWYLPFLFFGIFLFGAGLFLSVWAVRKIYALRKRK